MTDAHPTSPPLSNPRLSIVVPTYREVENLPFLVQRLEAVALAGNLEIELLIMDDDSRDGSDKAVEQLARPWVRFIVRTQNRGLSPAVLDGMKLARNPVIVVMDADLSHPPEIIPKLLRELEAGADFAVGSRFVEGGTTDDDWGLFRWLNSKVATLLAFPLTTIRDPMSGFFALRRETFAAGTDFNPIGYKIGLELMVKCRCRKIVEVPIHFADRTRGQSKLSFREQLKYIQHLRRLYIAKFGLWPYLARFLAVGACGALVNLAVLTLCLAYALSRELALAAGIGVSLLTNFTLSRSVGFSYARRPAWLPQLIGFVAACSLGAVVNYLVALEVAALAPRIPFQLAALAGIAAGMGFNFLINRLLVFKQRHVQKRS